MDPGHQLAPGGKWHWSPEGGSTGPRAVARGNIPAAQESGTLTCPIAIGPLDSAKSFYLPLPIPVPGLVKNLPHESKLPSVTHSPAECETLSLAPFTFHILWQSSSSAPLGQPLRMRAAASGQIAKQVFSISCSISPLPGVL